MARTAPDPDDQQAEYERQQREQARFERDLAEQRARGPVVSDDPWQKQR